MTPPRDESFGAPVVGEVLETVRSHSFNPINENDFTIDRQLEQPGISNFDDDDWKVRLLAIRDLVKAGTEAVADISQGLADDDIHVRYSCARALGVLRVQAAVDDLERVVRNDPEGLVRSEAVMALGRIGSRDSLELLRERLEADPSKDVRHQLELAIDRIEKGAGATDELVSAFRDLDPATFDTLRVGEPAPDFTMPDTDGRIWRLSDFTGGETWTILLWVFADWCPVCHGEFDELIELKAAFEAENVEVATIECHELYRGRVMVGEELEPDYWFSEKSFQEAYTNEIWWPHLLDHAGAVGATYGVDPLAYAVHAEYINRPATVILDPTGTVRFAYYGTFWGDRPSIERTLDMIRSTCFDFEHPDRLERNPA